MAARRRHAFGLDDLARLRRVSDPQVSPDGRWVAFVVEETDETANVRRAAVHLAPVRDARQPDPVGPPGGGGHDDGGGHPDGGRNESRPLTAGEQRDTDPRWSPDGRSIAFVSDRTGIRQLYSLSLDGGEARRLTDHPLGVSSPDWAPDGRRIAVVAGGADGAGEPIPEVDPDPRRRVTRVRELRSRLEGTGPIGPARPHVWLVSLDGSPMRQLTAGAVEDADPAWSPDGSAIAFTSDRSPGRDRNFGGAAVHVVDVASGEVRRVSPEGECAARPAWAPDGRAIAYVAGDGPVDVAGQLVHLYTVSPNGADRRRWDDDHDRGVGVRPGGYLTPSRPAWAPDGQSILHLLTDGSATRLARFWRTGRAIERLTAGTGSALAFTASAAADVAALLVAAPDAPAEVAGWSARAGAFAVTRLNGDVLDDVRLARRQPLRVLRPDGFEVEGWLFSPRGPARRPRPIVLMVHGGPHNLFGDTFQPDPHVLTSHGYAVLTVNPRGSGGYGERFGTAVHGDWGGADLGDLLAALDHVIATAGRAVDTDRVAIYGGSYGGFMVCWALGRTARFRVGVAGAPVTNLASMFGTSDIGPSWLPVEQGGGPVGRWAEILDRSPIAHVESVTAPLLLFHGEADLRVPIEQAEQFFVALRMLGRTVELLRVPGEGHVLPGDGSPVHDRAVREAILDWLDRYL